MNKRTKDVITAMFNAETSFSTEDFNAAKVEWEDFIRVRPITEKGLMVMDFFNTHESKAEGYTSSEIAEEIGLNGRSVSGIVKKLVGDGYIRKVNDKPASYSLI